jgi:enoyl-CoA hydratase/carnithine racemase
MAKWLQTTDHIQFEVRDRIATITFNRPDKRNAISQVMLREYPQALLEADDRNDVSVIVVRGAGKDFCAGFDLAGVYAGRAEDGARGDEARYRSISATFDDDCWSMERQQDQLLVPWSVHKPIIAKVHGYCLAGGTDIAFACDLVLAADDARIGFPAVRANGMPLSNMWLYHLGPQWAKRLMFTGDCLSGQDAARLGLVLDACPALELDGQVQELARRIACVDTEMLAAHKRTINLALELMGARTLQRLGAEMDARAHLSRGRVAAHSTPTWPRTGSRWPSGIVTNRLGTEWCGLNATRPSTFRARSVRRLVSRRHQPAGTRR